MGHDFERIRITAPAVPAQNGTAVLFDSTKHLAGGLSPAGASRLRLSFPGLDQPSAAGGLKGYSSPDKGANWYPFQFGGTVLPATVAAATATDFTAYDIFIGTAEDVKFELTIGTVPTVWNPVIIVKIGDDHAGA